MGVDRRRDVEDIRRFARERGELAAQLLVPVACVEPFLDEAIKTSPENNPPADAAPGVFAQVCDAETQKLYDAIWTNLKK